MNRKVVKKKEHKPFLGLPSKPSAQSLVARGLAVNEDTARIRLQQMYDDKADPKPEVSFYHSSDSDADQVSAANKQLDRCASLLKNIMEERKDVLGKKKAPALKSKLSQGTKTEKKKVVKIVLPNPNGNIHTGRSKSKAGRMVTSTPDVTGKIKSNKKKEGQLKDHISNLEAEKSLLQDQYSQLMKQHLSTPATNIPLHQKLGALSTEYQLNKSPFTTDSPASTSGLPKPFTPSSPTSSNMTSNQIFKELEKTIHGISEKLSFPGALTPRQQDHENSHNENASDRLRESGDLYKQPSDPLGSVRRNSAEELLGQHFKQDRTPTKRVSWSSASLDYQEIENSVVPNPYLPDSFKSSVSSTACSSELDEQTNLTLTGRENSGNDYTADSVDRNKGQSFHSLWSYYSDMQGYKDVQEVAESTTLKEMHSYYEENHMKSDEGINEVYDNVSERSANRSRNSVDFNGDRSKVVLDDEGLELNATVYTDSDNVLSGEEMANDEIDVSSDKEPDYDTVQQTRTTWNENFAENDKYNNSPKERELKTEETETTNTRKVLDAKERKSEKERKKRKQSSKTQKTEDIGQSKGYYVSPNGAESKRVMDVISQLAKIKFDDGKQPKIRDTKVHLGGIQPGYAATQVTALSYLFKELMSLLGEKTNSEEHRLLSEIDHMIGLLPFMISNLNPDLQTEINLAVQPLRLESSDLRRQLRIANQKIRDFEINVKDLQDSLAKAKKFSMDEAQLENLRRQMMQDEEERNVLKNKIVDISQLVESVKAENMRLVAKISEKDAESVRNKQFWQKEKSSIYSENKALKNKAESISLALQAQEKENKILRLSISQSEGEIIRVKELNRDLRESVSKLLQDVNFQDSRQKERRFNDIHEKQLHGDQVPVRDDMQWKAVNTRTPNNIPQAIPGIFRERPGNNFHEPSRKSLRQHSYAKGSNIYDKEIEIQQNSGFYQNNDLDSIPDKDSDLLSSTTISESASSCISKDGESIYNRTQSQNFDDHYSTLFCDSGEFRLKMADLSANMKKMQQALRNAKGS